jgi:hypothetical protein
MFYVSICSRCNCGLDGDRYAASHEDKECDAFLKLRKHYNVPKEMRIDQLDFQKALAYKKKHGKLPEVKKVK